MVGKFIKKKNKIRVMIKCVKYSGKKTSSVGLDKVNLIRDRVWVNVISPNDKELEKSIVNLGASIKRENN